MIKIFKWYIVSDLDLFIEKDTACRTLSRRIRYLEKENENLYFENDRLRNKQVQVTNIIEPKDITAKNYISEDKIRERIKHNEEQKNIVESVGKIKINDDGITGEGIEGLNDLIVYKSYEAVINELNYLLEEN